MVEKIILLVCLLFFFVCLSFLVRKMNTPRYMKKKSFFKMHDESLEKKNSYLKLCLDPELEKEAKKVKKGAITFTIAITALLVVAVGIIVFFLLRF